MIRIIFVLVIYILSYASLQAKGIVKLIPHLAVYDMQLDAASDESGMVGLSGRMVYEFKGSPCEGYNTRFRYVTKIDMEDVPTRLVDQQVVNFETANAKEFHFASKVIVDNQLNDEVEGSAKVENGTILVDLKKPIVEHYELPFAQFPIFQTEELIKNALEGKNFYRTTLYDGLEKANNINEMTVVIGAKKKALEDEETKIMGVFSGQDYWPVTISHFNDTESQDGLPIYRTSFKLYANGVTRDLFIDYRKFSVRAKLKKLQLLEKSVDEKSCK